MTTTEQHCKQTTCPYCGVGCGVEATIDGQQIVAVEGSKKHPANYGSLCVKGSALADSLVSKQRLLHPQIEGERVSWDQALETVAHGFQKLIDEYGPGSVAFYLSGQLLTEDYYVANKLMKGFIGSANVDTNSRLCMASAVSAYKRAFGADVVPCNYADLECCELLIIAGSNLAWTHPVLYQRISAAKQGNPEMKIVAIDPRRTASSEVADLHLAINPGSDAFLFNGLFSYLANNEALDEVYLNEHCQGFTETLEAAADCDISKVISSTGLNEPDLLQFYQWFAATERTVSFYSQGINQSSSGTDKCNAIINCHLATGRIGKAGMGPFSITGQPNAMGGREVGGLANQLAAHMDFCAENIDRVQRFWGAPNVAQQPGYKAIDLFDAMAEGEIKAIWIMATNPVVSLPNSASVKKALEKCELVVVSDCIANTDTNKFANVLLPATGWGEKDGTVTNSERTISRQRALFAPSGEARHDWEIVCDVAARLGFRKSFNFHSAGEIFSEHAALSAYENGGTRAFDLDLLKNITADEYASLEPVQWPINDRFPAGSPHMFADGKFFTANGKANLIPIAASLSKRSQSKNYPYLLNTGRVRDQWHTMSRTGNVAKLMLHTEYPQASLNPVSAKALGIQQDQLVCIRSRQGSITVLTKLDDGINSGEVFVPIHWNDQFTSNGTVSQLFDSRVDPISGQPESKLEAVSIDPLGVAKWVAIVSKESVDVKAFNYWHQVPVTGGTIYLAAYTDIEGPCIDLNVWVETHFTGNHSKYIDEISGNSRHLFVSNNELQAAVFVSSSRSSLPSSEWLKSLFTITFGEDKWQLLAGKHRNRPEVGNLICSCHEVGELTILKAIAAGTKTTKALGERLKCGTNCGSCIPELNKLINAQQCQPAGSQKL